MQVFRGILSIVLGGGMIIGGATGKIALKGTDSSGGAIVLGVVVVLIGVWRIASAQKSQS